MTRILTPAEVDAIEAESRESHPSGCDGCRYCWVELRLPDLIATVRALRAENKALRPVFEASKALRDKYGNNREMLDFLDDEGRAMFAAYDDALDAALVHADQEKANGPAKSPD